jgi:nitrous oxide reductase accessory protein NosL
MKTSLRIASGLALVALLAACGAAEDAPRDAPPPVQDTAFGEMVGTMDKARGVENTTLQHKEDIDEAVRESEGEGER